MLLKLYKERVNVVLAIGREELYVICTVHYLDFIKMCSDKFTLFIVCYLIQFILKIVQHVSNHVTVHPQGLNYLLHQLSTYVTH
jgi:hypothetical protein